MQIKLEINEKDLKRDIEENIFKENYELLIYQISQMLVEKCELSEFVDVNKMKELITARLREDISEELNLEQSEEYKNLKIKFSKFFKKEIKEFEKSLEKKIKDCLKK